VAVTCCSFSPAGGNVATAAADGVVRVWAPAALPAPDASRTALLQCPAPVSALTWDLRAGERLWESNMVRSKQVNQLRQKRRGPAAPHSCSAPRPLLRSPGTAYMRSREW